MKTMDKRSILAVIVSIAVAAFLGGREVDRLIEEKPEPAPIVVEKPGDASGGLAEAVQLFKQRTEQLKEAEQAAARAAELVEQTKSDLQQAGQLAKSRLDEFLDIAKGVGLTLGDTPPQVEPANPITSVEPVKPISPVDLLPVNPINPVSPLQEKVKELLNGVGDYKGKYTKAAEMAATFDRLSRKEGLSVDDLTSSTQAANSALLGDELPRWQRFLDALGVELDRYVTPDSDIERYQAVWREVARGLDG